MKKGFVALLVVLGLGVALSTQVTLFVVPPIGAVPDGRTLVILRLQGDEFETKFIDSADAICERHMGGVNLLCRGIALAAIGENATVLVRLPYVEFLEGVANGGVLYGR